jgi:hypothetical protein
MKRIFLTALLLGVLNFLCCVPSVLAFSDNQVSGPLPSPSIVPRISGNSLTEIDYFVSSSAPTNSIRYKTLDYYVTFHNTDGTTITYTFQPIVSAPPSGIVYDEFVVTAADLESAGFSPSSLQESDFSKISLSATIEIYNASTGTVYDTFGTSISTSESIDPVIEQVGATYGFPQQDVVDMESRFTDTLNPPGAIAPNSFCSLDPTSTASLTAEQVSGQWSYDYWDWVEYCDKTSCWDECQIVSVLTGPYYEKMWMTISPPDPAIVKAGQGTSVTVTTYYENNDPSSWNGSSYRNGIQSVSMSGPNTDDWQSYKLNQTRITANMVLQSTNVYYEDYYPITYSTGCNGGWFTNGYNVPVVEQTWVIPYARFDDNGWTMSQTPPTDIDNQYVFGGLYRWYFGFDIPDGQNFSLQFMAQGGTTRNMEVCGNDQISIKGSPYDDFIVTTIDPSNPFPGGEPTPWQGFESNITNLAIWFREPEIEFEKRVVQWKTETLPGKIFTFLTGDVQHGVKSMASP